ncbi:MAG: helix-turn-helix domain-containing protein [Thermomicrobia bacterium]|nr:helix-turn-helix domain-containing protein [Thermomicrobia bacterium]
MLVADGKRPVEAAASIACSQASVYAWLARWRADGLTGLAEAPHPAPIQAHAAPLETLLTALLADDPQQQGHHATGWTIALLHGEAAAAGIRVSEHTVRRAVRRLGWRWKRPKYVLGRPDPAYAEKKGRLSQR